jgi:hypothetical protein
MTLPWIDVSLNTRRFLSAEIANDNLRRLPSSQSADLRTRGSGAARGSAHILIPAAAGIPTDESRGSSAEARPCSRSQRSVDVGFEATVFQGALRCGVRAAADDCRAADRTFAAARNFPMRVPGEDPISGSI